MNRHNYTQYANKKFEEPAVDIVEDESVIETEVSEVEVTPIMETVEPEVPVIPEIPEAPKMVTGVIVDCAKLNVRVAPNIDADVECVLNVASEIEIDVFKSTDEWFHVCTAAGVEGYCMRKFVDAAL